MFVTESVLMTYVTLLRRACLESKCTYLINERLLTLKLSRLITNKHHFFVCPTLLIMQIPKSDKSAPPLAL
jgi:hypothetical protein